MLHIYIVCLHVVVFFKLKHGLKNNMKIPFYDKTLLTSYHSMLDKLS